MKSFLVMPLNVTHKLVTNVDRTLDALSWRVAFDFDYRIFPPDFSLALFEQEGRIRLMMVAYTPRRA